MLKQRLKYTLAMSIASIIGIIIMRISYPNSYKMYPPIYIQGGVQFAGTFVLSFIGISLFDYFKSKKQR